MERERLTNTAPGEGDSSTIGGGDASLGRFLLTLQLSCQISFGLIHMSDAVTDCFTDYVRPCVSCVNSILWRNRTFVTSERTKYRVQYSGRPSVPQQELITLLSLFLALLFGG